jgi:putative ABC transport system permease protein
MKYFHYIFRNARRNPVRSTLTIASTAICLCLMMILVSFFAIRDDVAISSRVFNRVATLNANGFAGFLPIACVNEISRMDGVKAVTPFSWYGGKYQDQVMPFAQFGVYPETVMTVLDEFSLPQEQLRAFKENQVGCLIGRKLAEDKGLKVGDSLPLQGDAYPVDLQLRIVGIYDGPSNRNLRMCLFNWKYLDEKMKLVATGLSTRTSANSTSRLSGNAGIIFTKCKSGDDMAGLCRKIDDLFRNSEFPTRTQTEEAFGKMFEEMLGDLKTVIWQIGTAVVFSLFCVAGNSMAMSMRERTSEVAVLKAIGFTPSLVLFMILTEAVLVSGFGGVLGSLGTKAIFEYFDISPYTAGFLPFFYIPWNVALQGVAVSLLIGVASGLYPAIRASSLSVVDGLRRVI